MSIRRNHKDAVKSRAKITRMRDKALKMLARVRATTLAMQERRAARISWWQRAFRVPLVGFYGWVRSRCSTLWAAFMTIIGLKPSVARTAFAARHGEIKQTKQAQTRRLIHETMEARQLLAADVTVVANDTFAQEDPSASPYPNTGQFYIQLDTIHGTDVEVEYALTGTANSENADYVAEVSSSPVPATGTITIKAGATSAVLDIDVIDDDLYDGGDETVILTLTKVSAPLTISKSSDSMSIVDNETAPTISIKATDASAAEPSDTGEFTITQTGKSDADTTVAISYTGTAHPSDYTAASSATITKGTTSATVTVTPTADTLIEGDETVIAKLGAVTANPGIKAVAPTSATVTISDTEDTGSVDVIVNFGPSSISEPSGKTSFDIAILPNKSSTDTVIKYSISGDATEDVDYTLGFSSEREPNNTTAGPQAGVGPQGLAGFSLAKNADIANSTSVPHVSVISTAGTNTAINDDVYAFYTKTGGAATFDIDGTTGVDTYIELIGTDGTTVLAANNDSASVDSGSASKADSSLTFTLPTAGVYYLRVTDATKAGIPIGASYTAHLSVPGSQGYAVIGGGDISGIARTIFDVTVLDDTIVEASEPVHITLDSIVQGDPQITLSTTKGALDAEVVITDNDSATISIAGTTNGQEPSTNGLFTITQTLKSSVDTIIPWTLDPTSTAKNTKNGTLADPADHSLAMSGEVTIKAGTTQATIVVPVLDSALIEEDETVVISIGAPTKGDPDVTLGAPSKASILIGDEDTATVDVDAKLAPAHEGAADGKFTFFLSEPPGYPTGTPGQADRDTVITFSIGGTATYGVDYDLVGATVSGGIGTVTIKAFSSTADVTVDATGAFDDLDLEGTEAITLTILTLEAPTDSNIKIGTGSPADSMDLIDNDGLTVKVEGTKDAFEGGALGEFTFSTVGIGTTAVPTVVTYQVKVGSSTAIEGTDFAPLTGKVTIPAGAASQSNTVSIDATGIYDDLLFEGNETVTVEILKVSGGPGLTIDAQSSDDILIIDDEPGTVTIVDIIDAAEATKNGSFTIELGGQSPLPTVIKYEILATKTAATPGSDYKSLGSPYGTVTLNPFVTQAVVPVEVINDTISEGVETVDIKLVSVVSGQPYALGPDGKVNIYSDQLVSVKATDATAGEPSDDGKFTVYLELKDLPGTAASSDVDLVVSYSILTTGSNNATNGVDYATLTGLATIPAGQTSVDIVVDVTDDLTLEATEKVQLRLTGVSGEGDVTLAGTAATDAVRNAVVTISDNDFSYLTVKATKTPGQDNPGSDVDAEFTVYMSQPADQDTVVSYDVSGSATAKTDYTLLSGLVTILKNTTSATITVDVLNDLLIEGTETVTIDLKDPQTLPSKAAHPYDDRIFLGALGTSYIGPGDALLSFQDGGLLGFGPYASGIYTGTQDAYVQQSTVGVNFGVGAVLIDTDNFPGPATAALHGLIKFDDILGTGFGLIPSGSPLLSASLNLNTFDPGPVSFHRMLANWDETTITWASSTLGGNIQPGIQADGVEAVVASSGSGLAFGLSSTPLTADVQGWVNGKAGLFGWAVLPGGVNATAFKGSEAITVSDRPMLDVHLDVSATIEIIDTDVATVNVVGSKAGAEPSTKAEIIIGLLDGSNTPVSSSSPVTVSYSDVTPAGAGYAISGSDYAKLSGSVVIPAGATQTSIFIVPNDDSLIEDPETVKINITSVTSADPEITKGSKVDGSTVINDNDFGLVTIKATQSAADENTIGNTKLAPIDGEFTVYISTPSDTDTVVELTITGSATNGADYKTISNFVTIPANQLSAKIPVQVIDDVINESATEDVTLNIVSIKSGHAAIIPASPSSATVFIADDEQVLAASVKATKASASEQIGVSSVDGELQIQLNWASDEDTVIEYSVGGTATDAKVTTLPDYDASQFPGVDATTIDGLGGKTMVGKITIKAGATNAVFPVDVFNDYVAE
ncbi:MAG: DNRLRE domain-containing protein, partial [Planctomycetales bacterium]|nr:DNRLRE domain-containing protein [Planctomycetales bacterium]